MGEPAWRDKLRSDIARRLDEIRELFVRPDEVKITVVIRVPWKEDGDSLVTNDTVDEAVKALRELDAKGVRDNDPDYVDHNVRASDA
jgi:hypothetical protein